MKASIFPSLDAVRYYLQVAGERGVEQWLGHRCEDGFRFIRWIRIIRESAQDGPALAVYEKVSLDVGDENFIDMDEFVDVGDPDEPEGRRNAFDSVHAALEFARGLGAEDAAYVAGGSIQDIYLSFVSANGKAEKGAADWYSAG